MRLVLLGALAAASIVPAAAEAPAAGPAAPTTAVWRICSNCSQFGLGDGSRYSYVTLHSWQSSLIAGLKAKNPSIKVLVYKNASASYSYACRNGLDDAALPAGVGYCWAGVNRPGWFLSDTSGKRIEFCDYPGLWLMDVGDPGYEQQWLANVSADAKAKGFDGVFIDDVNQTSAGHLCDRTIAKYPSESSFSAAMTSFMARVGPGLTSRGLLALPNIMIRNWWEQSGLDLWDTWVSYSSGAVQEYYTKWNSDSSGWFTDDGGWHNDWSYRQAFLQRTQAAGKIFLGLTYAPAADARSQRYARASFLADWDGGPSALAFEPTNPEQQDPYQATWTADLGAPLGASYQVGLVWRRNFVDGVIVVNPSTTQQTVSLGGSYQLPNGALVTSVTLSSADAAILRNAPVLSPPVNTVLPAITVQADRRTLAGTPGVWSGSPTSYAYAWSRCNATVTSCIDIPGATGPGYVLSVVDAGSRLRLRVTATNPGGKAAATSQPTAVVASSGRL
jgi:hypothetical protein